VPIEGPFNIEDAASWVRAALPEAGQLEIVQEEPWASVYRAPVEDSVVWFKACAPHLAFEVPLTAALSSRWPATVTEVIASDDDRRWLLMRDAGASLETLGNPPERWLEVLPAYAELQIGETAHTEEHLAWGVPDLRPERLPALAGELSAVDLPLEAAERATLRSLMPRFRQMCEELDGLGIAPSIQHDDLHVTNVYLKDRLRVLDWGDSVVSHPFFSLFVTFRFLAERNGFAAGDPWYDRLRDAYLEPWGGDQRRTFELALRASGIAHAVEWLAQRDTVPAAELPDFNRWFAVILRLALARATHET
jgi:hypothetical protein